MHYQKVVNLADVDGQPAYYEALLRISVQGIQVRPEVVFDLAEELGVVHMLDSQIIAKVAADTALLDAAVSLNVASLESAVSVLSDYKGTRLIIELSEYDPLVRRGDLSSMVREVNAVSEMGFPVYLDDYGAGDVHAEHIGPWLTGVKLDRRLTKLLVRACSQTPSIAHPSATALTAMLATLRKAGLSITAEGIETLADYRAIRPIADNGQGWAFGVPLPLPLILPNAS